MRNLLDNAVRYSAAGRQVDIILDAGEFRVRDNGPGISAEALTRIGERFYRPPGQEQPGSGLGLSIVKRIAALHGMTVPASTTPGTADSRRAFAGSGIIAKKAKDFAHFAHFTALPCGVKLASKLKS